MFNVSRDTKDIYIGSSFNKHNNKQNSQPKKPIKQLTLSEDDVQKQWVEDNYGTNAAKEKQIREIDNQLVRKFGIYDTGRGRALTAIDSKGIGIKNK